MQVVAVMQTLVFIKAIFVVFLFFFSNNLKTIGNEIILFLRKICSKIVYIPSKLFEMN
jgi:hypothetical protein